MSLPSVDESCNSIAKLDELLSTLLEPSKSLKEHLAPALSSSIASSQNRPKSYAELVDLSEQEVASWSQDDKADFLGGHPRIGEVKNLSALSSKEQNNAQSTPQEVLDKLQTLNALYESRYPKLKYVTYVAGRSRAQVADDLESFLMGGPADKTGRDSEGIDTSPIETYPTGSEAWVSELERGLKDVFLIAKARLKALRLQ